MKTSNKLLALTLSVLMFLSLCACGAQSAKGTPTAAQSSSFYADEAPREEAVYAEYEMAAAPGLAMAGAAARGDAAEKNGSPDSEPPEEDPAKIIYAADKADPARGYDSSALIAACYKNYYLGFLTVLDANRDYLKEKGYVLDNPLTKECMELYLGEY
jgi:hypothetical protein